MDRHRSESPSAALAVALRDVAYILDQLQRPISLGVFLTDEVDANRPGVVHFYPRTPLEKAEVKRAVRVAADEVEVKWVTEKLIAPAETAKFGQYLELSVEYMKGDSK